MHVYNLGSPTYVKRLSDSCQLHTQTTYAQQRFILVGLMRHMEKSDAMV